MSRITIMFIMYLIFIKKSKDKINKNDPNARKTGNKQSHIAKERQMSLIKSHNINLIILFIASVDKRQMENITEPEKSPNHTRNSKILRRNMQTY